MPSLPCIMKEFLLLDCTSQNSDQFPTFYHVIKLVLNFDNKNNSKCNEIHRRNNLDSNFASIILQSFRDAH